MTYPEAKNQPGVNLVEFYATWCPHCRRMMPVVDEIRELASDSVGVYQFDIDTYADDAEMAGADTVPTFIVYRDGIERWRKTGEMPGDEILAALKR